MIPTKEFTSTEAKRLGDLLKVDWKQFDVEEFRKGLQVELEHGLCDLETNITHNNATLTAKIVLAHLNRIPDYYTRLEKMEREIQSDNRHRKSASEASSQHENNRSQSSEGLDIVI